MAKTITDLYNKYANKVRTLENDRYFQYLFEMVQAGNNTFYQSNRVMHKVVDEKWLTEIEDSLDAIFKIIEKPRRFIATTEEVVPVALAKKITADSVRHLSQNTQFIASTKDGDIQPTKVLNVTTEESFDLYENRFVYHLIQRLATFVDKRTDIVFWATGDETMDVMRMESSVDDAYEQISYKLEMTIKNRQNYAENDTDNMPIFMRIDRVRRMVRTLRASSFCDIMKGCAKVRSPIQRTNLMMKDPQYRTCYKLWHFLENYDDVGYSIEQQDTTLEFDEEYLIQMYTSLITNYAVFKSLLESDPRKAIELNQKKKKPIKPKFVRKIEEEQVDDYDVPDVEVKKVIVEEVTQAQLDAEAALKEEKAHTQELEKNLSNLQWSQDTLQKQLDDALQERFESDRAQKKLQKQLDELKAAQEKTIQELAELRVQYKQTEQAQQATMQQCSALAAQQQATLARAETAEQALAAAKQAEAQSAKMAQEAAAKAEGLKAQYTVAAAERADAQAHAQAVQQALDASRLAEKKSAQAAHEALARAEKAETDCQVARTEAQQAQTQAANAMAAEVAAKAKQTQAEQQAALAEQAQQAAVQERIAAQKAQQAAEEESRMAREAERLAKTIADTAQSALRDSQLEVDKLRKQRDKAIAKAEENSLSKYIVTSLRQRKEEKQRNQNEQ